MVVLLFLVVSSSLGVCRAEKKPSMLERIPDILQQFCPGINVCNENQSTEAPTKVFMPGFGSCCTECSCGPNCAEMGNCCFPYEMPAGQEDDEELEVVKNDRSCLLTTTLQPTGRDLTLYQSFYMVSSVPENHQNDPLSMSNNSCGDESVAPWGSLYPVYSAEYKRIYKNIECATTAGVTDAILWDAVLYCRTDRGFRSDVSSFVRGLDSNSVPNNCAVSFIYPGNLDDIRPFTCYVGLIDTCSESAQFQTPKDAGLPKEDITALCTSGLVSPYRRTNMYANVFCHICNAQSFTTEMFCKTIDRSTSKGPYTRGFIGLLDETFIINGRKKNLGEEKDIPVACASVNTSRCGPVFCPSGQLRDRTGRCRYPSKVWYAQEYTVFISLTSEVVNITDVFTLGASAVILPALKSPWSKNWLIDIIWYEIMDESKTSTAFLVKLKNKKSTVPPRNIIQYIKDTVMQDWLLKQNNATIVLKANFSAVSVIKPIKLEGAQLAFGIRTENLFKPRYSEVYSSRDIAGQVLPITKLYLCYQVELMPSEFIVNPDESILFNTITQRFMFDSEFILISCDTFVCARICIEDSEMFEMNKGTSSNVRAFNDVCLLRIGAIAVLFGFLNI